MPKKTKKQKMLAELRRKLAAANNTSQYEPKLQLVKKQKQSDQSYTVPASTASFAIQNKSATKPKTATLLTNYSYVKHDLIKITIFTLFALIFQGMLYFLLNRG